MVAATHGLVYDDIRHLSRLRMTVDVGRVELLSATTPTPLSAVTVSRALVTVEGSREVRPAAAGEPERDQVAELLLVRRRWLAGSLVEELTLRNPHSLPASVHLELEVGADFAHVFDVKSGTAHGAVASAEAGPDGTWTLRSPHDTRGLHPGGHAATPGRGRREPGHRGLAPARGRAGRGRRHGHRAARLRRRRRRPGASLAAGTRHGAPRAPRVALGAADRRLARPAAADRRRPGAHRPGGAADRRPGAPGARRRRRRGAVVHDALRSRLAPDGLDDAALRRLPRPRRAGQPRRAAGRAGRPGVRGAARPHHARASAARRKRAVHLPQPLLRDRRRHSPLRRPRRRGLAVAEPSTRSRCAPWPPPSDAPSTGSSVRATPTATASSTTGGAIPGGSPTRAGRTRGTASPAPTARCPRRRSPSSRCRATRTPPCAEPPSWPGTSTSVMTPPTCCVARTPSRTASTRPSGTGAAGSSSASTPTTGPSTRSPRTPGTRCGPASPTTTRRGSTSSGWPTRTSGRGGACAPWPVRWRRTTR